MAKFEIKMPKLGESITEGTIISWSVKVGDTINEDDILFEVNTAKVSAEIPSPVSGKKNILTKPLNKTLKPPKIRHQIKNYHSNNSKNPF